MRYVRLFLLHFQNLLEHRSRPLVWFLVGIIDPLVILLYWKGAYVGKESIAGWTFEHIVSYYIFLLVLAPFLFVHIEEDIAKIDIQKGELVKYIIRPFSYFWFKFFEEIPYRLLEGIYGIFFCLLFILLGNIVIISNNIEILVLSSIVIVLAYGISYIFKAILGLLAFWITDISGVLQFMEVVFLIFAGFIVPISLLPEGLYIISKLLPFAYMMYFPVIALQGKLAYGELLRVISIQILWILCLYSVYRFLWNKGVRTFTAVGQ